MVYEGYNAGMKRILKTTLLINISLFLLNGCTYNCSCEDKLPEQNISNTPRPTPKGEQLLNECKYIDEGIADSNAFSKKMAKSRYAMQYLAMSRERISSLQARAKKIGCP